MEFYQCPHPHPPPSLPLCPPILIEQERAAIIPTASSSTLFPESAPQLVQAAIVPPPPDLQPIVDKLANYVARNGEDFESTVKRPRMMQGLSSLNPWNAHYSILPVQETTMSAAAEKEEQFSWCFRYTWTVVMFFIIIHML